jgi:hypothetical protein
MARAMDLHVRTAPDDSDRHRRARSGVASSLWERWRPILGWTLLALFAAILLTGVRRGFQAASTMNTGGCLSKGPGVKRGAHPVP